jgi:hypothetical protein
VGALAQTCGARARKSTAAITDRAKRYRANTPECRPTGARICEYCGSRQNVEVHHRNGNESDTTRKNLAWACRSCNTKIGIAMKRRGQGVRTRQFNPAESMAQWVAAVLSANGESNEIPQAEAIEIVHATPAADRSKFARQIWQRRRKGHRKNPAELLIFGNPPKRRKVSRKKNAGLFDAIRPGSRVTIVNRFGQSRSGRAVMRGPHGWVLNMGGPHGTPAIATPDNVTKVRAGNPPKHLEVFFDNAIKKYTAVIYDPDLGGNLYASGYTKKQAAKALHQQVRDLRAGRRDRHTGQRKNPSETEQAVRLFETFHGKQAGSIVEKHVSAAMRKDYTALGNLLYVKVKTPVGQTAKFEFEHDGVMLASSPDGKQLYCIGGNQNLLPLLDDDSKQKDFLDLGECQEVAYLARKIHSDYEPIEWFHKFGEARDGSTKPQLMFDRLKKQLFFVGGEYWIDPDVDISPGIEN